MGRTSRARYDVNISILFTELPFLKRPAAVKNAGFDAIEMWWPFNEPVPDDRDADDVIRAIQDAGVRVALLNFDAGDMSTGDRGLVSVPSKAHRFRANIDATVSIAASIGCRRLNAVYGNKEEDVDPKNQKETAIENLALAAEAASRIGAKVCIEALNPLENPSYPLTRSTDVLTLLSDVRANTGHELAWQYDVYHMQRTEGNLTSTILQFGPSFGHVQIADAPGRNEPGTGEIAFERVLDALFASGYEGMVGLEYRPSRSSAESFGWLHSYLGDQETPSS